MTVDNQRLMISPILKKLLPYPKQIILNLLRQWHPGAHSRMGKKQVPNLMT